MVLSLLPDPGRLAVPPTTRPRIGRPDWRKALPGLAPKRCSSVSRPRLHGRQLSGPAPYRPLWAVSRWRPKDKRRSGRVHLGQPRPGASVMNVHFHITAMSNHVLTAVGGDGRAGDEAGVVGGEERDDAGDFVGLAETADRNLRQDHLVHHVLRHRHHHLG